MRYRLAVFLIYNLRMWLRRAFRAVVILVLATATPAILAPYVSDRPVDWAYRFYHPGLYRYPILTGIRLREASSRMEREPRWVQSVQILGLMVEYW